VAKNNWDKRRIRALLRYIKSVMPRELPSLSLMVGSLAVNLMDYEYVKRKLRSGELKTRRLKMGRSIGLEIITKFVTKNKLSIKD